MTELREQIARIVDPHPWQFVDNNSSWSSVIIPSTQAALDASLVKADAILALVRPQLPAVVPEELQKAAAYWNVVAKATAEGLAAHRLSPIRKLTDAMKVPLKARLKEGGIEGWYAAVDAVARNAHCRGINDRGWKADFSYLLQAKGFGKALNGGWPADYEEKSRGGQRVGPGGRGDQRLDGLRGFDAAIRGGAAGGVGRGGGGAQGRPGPEAAGGGAGGPQHRLTFGPPGDGE